MNALQIAIVADTYTKQLYMVNLKNYPLFFDRFYDLASTELTMQGISSIASIKLIKENFNLDVDIYYGAKMWEVWMDERNYVEFMLRYA